MARPRKKNNITLAPNLYFDKTNNLYKYKHPQTRKFHYLGSDKNKALVAAKQLNSLLMSDQDLVAKVLGTSPTLQYYITYQFEKVILPERNLSKVTQLDYERKLKIIKKSIGELQINLITIKNIADFLASYPPTQANRYRSLLSLIFKYAVAEGVCDNNPVEHTLNRKLIKQRSRLTLEAFHLIYQFAEPWLKNAMDIGLLTLQRREDITKMKFSDIKDGFLFVIQGKTAKHGSAGYLKIKIGERLSHVISRCRDRVNSEYIIHRKPQRFTWKIKSKAQTQITPDYLSKAFAAARDKTDFYKDLLAGQKPSFHEIRSLGIKLYEDAGLDAQALAGHKSRSMTEQYKVGHEPQWTMVETELSSPAFEKNS